MLHLPSSQLRFLRLLLLSLCRRSFHHLARLCCRLCEVVLEFGRAALQARDRPANVVITDGVRQAITIRDDCTTHTINPQSASQCPCKCLTTRGTHLRHSPSRRGRARRAARSRAPSGSSSRTPRPCRSRAAARPPSGTSSARTGGGRRPVRRRPKRRTGGGGRQPCGTAQRVARPIIQYTV